MGWSDIGSWAAVHELLAKHPAENIFAGPGHTLDAEGNFLWSPGKYVAAIGVSGLVVVETPDAFAGAPERSEEHTSNSSHQIISYAVFCLKKKKKEIRSDRRHRHHTR